MLSIVRLWFPPLRSVSLFYGWGNPGYTYEIESSMTHYNSMVSNDTETGPFLEVYLSSFALGVEISNLEANGSLTLVVQNWDDEAIVNISELTSIEQIPMIIGSRTRTSPYRGQMRDLIITAEEGAVQVELDIRIWTESPPPPVAIVVFPWHYVLALMAAIVYGFYKINQVHTKHWQGWNGPIFVASLILFSILLMSPNMHGNARGDFFGIETSDAIPGQWDSFVLNESISTKIKETNGPYSLMFPGSELLTCRLASSEEILVTVLNEQNATVTEFVFQGEQLEWWIDPHSDEVVWDRIQLAFLTSPSEVRFEIEGTINDTITGADPTPSMILLTLGILLLPLAFWRALRIDYELGRTQNLLQMHGRT